jgi:hypothetical protein
MIWLIIALIISVFIIVLLFISNNKKAVLIGQYKKVLKVEEHAIHELEDIMKSKEEIERVEDEKKKELKKISGDSAAVSAFLNKLSD